MNRFGTTLQHTCSLATLMVFSLAACAAPASSRPMAAVPTGPTAAVNLQALPLQPPQSCTGAFIAHDLAHTTQAPGESTRLFDSNGAGLAVNDLDGDGDDEIVLANLAGPASILWNEGGLHFDRQELPFIRRARAVAIVDVNGDGRQDIVFTNGAAAPAALLNAGDHTFQLAPLRGVDKVAYAMNWNDLDGDGDLDLVTGAYDAGRMLETNGNALFGASPGVNVYAQDGELWHGTQLTTTAQALAIGLWDLDGDLRPDIWVGNDFDLPDTIWLQTATGAWRAATPFAQTAHSTMSLDRGDVDGDGAGEFFATDMKPYDKTTRTLAAWLPLMQEDQETFRADGAQVTENALQVWEGGRYQNRAYDRNIDASGWSWSAKFGDLDNDGDLDLYAVNGMIAADLLGHLPGGELVEANQALRNDGTGHFAVAADWGLGSTRSGRGMSMADFDRDGDLDVVVNNLGSAAQLFENQLCPAGTSLELELRWPGTANPFAVGATVWLYTDRGVAQRDVRAVSGYLSGDPVRLHFGVPEGAVAERMEIRWPDGAVSRIDQPPLGQQLIVTR